MYKRQEYARSDMYPFHMPGHKRTGDMGFPDPFTVDITEIDGFDNLHHPEGILQSSMDLSLIHISAFFVSYLRIGADLVNRSSDIPTEMIAILQSIIILLISAERFLHKYRQNWIEKEAKA